MAVCPVSHSLTHLHSVIKENHRADLTFMSPAPLLFCLSHILIVDLLQALLRSTLALFFPITLIKSISDKCVLKATAEKPLGFHKMEAKCSLQG